MRWLLLLLTLVLLPWAALLAEENPAEDPGEGKNAPAAKAEAPRRPVPLEALKIPSGGVLVLVKDAQEAFKLIPDAVLLTPERFQEIQEQLEQLKRLTRAERPETPSACRIRGKVDGEVVRLQIQFDFKTYRPRAQVHLGCSKAWPTAATLDGQEKPWLQVGDEGFLVQVDTPGAHTVHLDLVVPAGARGGKSDERGFELDLPGTAITTLDALELPPAVNRVLLGARPHSVRANGRLEAVPLGPGPVSRLELSWRGSVHEPRQGPPLLAAETQAVVRVEEAQVLTDVTFKLQVLSGETDRWQIHFPLAPAATPELLRPQGADERVQEITLPTPEKPLLQIRLREASSDPVEVTVQVRQPRPTGPIPVGPYAALGTFRQRGDLQIRPRPELRLHHAPAAEVGQREVTEAQRRDNTVAAFTYWYPAVTPASAAALPPPLTLTVEPVKGVVESSVSHQLRWHEREGWRLTSTFQVTPHRAAVDHFDVHIPANYRYDEEQFATPADLVEEVTTNPTTRAVQIRLVARTTRPFAVTLEGVYAQPRDAQEASLELPRLANPPGAAAPTPWVDRGGQVTVTAPDGSELTVRPARAEAATATTRATHTWKTNRTPLRADLHWRPYRPDLPVDAEVLVRLSERHARVEQRLTYQFTQGIPAQVVLQIPPTVSGVEVREGGTAVPQEREPDELHVTLAQPGKEAVLKVDYLVTLAEDAAGGAFPVPLLRPREATRGRVNVAVWNDPSGWNDPCLIPVPVGGRWEVLRREAPPGERVPDLVAAANLGVPLTLRLTPSAAAPLASAVVDRALVRAAMLDDGSQTYRTRFFLSRVNTRHLDLELPLPLSRAGILLVQYDRQPRRPLLLNEAGKEAESGRTLRLADVGPDRGRPALLEILYRLDPGRLEGNELFQTVLRPPTLAGAAYLGRVRWHVEVPSGRLALAPRGHYTTEQRWGLVGWLPGPRPAAGAADLERWLTGNEPAPTPEEGDPALVCWQTALVPLQVIHVPRQFWLLVCSLTVLAVGLLLALAPLPPPAYWGTVAFLCLIAAAVVLALPAALPTLLYGCVPGAAILGLALAFHWALQQRYRRQLVFMPGYARPQGSSLVRSGNGPRPRDASTTDEPPRRGSSIVPS